MELNRCSRCGSFYVANGNVCPKCSKKDGFEFSAFKSYVQENGLTLSLDTISGETGISVNNLNRFLGYPEFQDFQKEIGIIENINVQQKNNISVNNNSIFNG